LADLVYHSATGVTKRIAESLGGIPLSEYTGGSYVLLFPSYGSPRTGGYIPGAVRNFLADHGDGLIAVAGVGNLTFGSDFCLGARLLANEYEVPLVAKFDMVPTGDQLSRLQEAMEWN